MKSVATAWYVLPVQRERERLNNNQHIHASTVSSERTFISQNESEKSVTATRCAATSLDLTRYCLQYKAICCASIKKMGRQKLEEWPAPVIERVTAGVMCAIHLCLLRVQLRLARRFYAYHR
jgi:Asp/Glu/hydantoin racemase